MASGIEVAKAYVTIVPSMKGIQGEISKQLGIESISTNAGKTFGDGLLSGLGSVTGKLSSALGKTIETVAAATAVGAAAATTAVAGVSKAALDSYADYEQLAGGVQKLYGNSADQLMKYAQQAYQTSGMSANQYMEQATSFSAALIKSVGGDTQEAARLTDVAMRAMSDNVNTFGSNAQDVQNAFMGLSRENYTMLDNLKLGYAGTKQGMLELINDSGVLGEKLTDTSQLSEVGFGKMVEAIQAVQEQQRIAGTTANEAATTISGSIEMTKASWSNLLTELGKDDGDVSARVGELVDSALLVVENAAPRLVQIVGALIQKVPPAIAQNAPKVLAAMTELLDGVTDGAFSRAMTKIQPSVDRIGGAISGLMDRLAPLAPYAEQIGSALGDILATGFDAVSRVVETLAPILASIAEVAFPAIADAITLVSDGLEQFVEMVTAAFEWLGESFGKIGDFLKDPMGSVLDFGKGVTKSFTDTGKSVRNTAGTTERNVSKSFSTMSKNAQSHGSSMQKGVSASFASMYSNGSKSASSLEGATTRSMSTAEKNGIGSSNRLRAGVVNDMTTAASTTATKMTGLEGSIRTSMTTAASTTATKMTALESSVKTSTGNAATSSESNSNRIKAAWNKSYKMTLNSEAKTSDAENKLRKLYNNWNGSSVSFYGSASTWDADSSFSRLYSKWNGSTITFYSYFSGGGGGGFGGSGGGGAFASGAIIQKHADGFIANRPGRGVDITRHIAGEAGAEAIIPLTNKRYVRPFAETVAELIDVSNGGVTVTGNTFIVRSDRDISAIGRAINDEAERVRRSRL